MGYGCIKIRVSQGIISQACGIHSSVFVEPRSVTLKGDPFQVGVANNTVDIWMELVEPDSAQALVWYDHPHWGRYAAVTRNNFGKGWAMYIACLPSAANKSRILAQAAQESGCWGVDQELVSGAAIEPGQEITLPGWGFAVIEERS